MKKTLMLVASVAMAVVLTGCGGSKKSAEEQEKAKEKSTADVGSPKTVAEDFAKAIIQKDPGKAFEFCDTVSGGRHEDYALLTKEQKDNLKRQFEDLGKEINDEKYDCKAILETVEVPPEVMGYTLVNGKKYTGEKATVLVQFMKGGDKKPNGLRVNLVKVDGSWKVKGYSQVSGLDTSSEDSGRDDRHSAAQSSSASSRRDREPDSGYYKVTASTSNRAYIARNKYPAEEFKRPSRAVSRSDDDEDSTQYRVHKYERICREFASLLKKEGREISEDDLEEEIEKFKKYSSEKQKEELETAERVLKMKRQSASDAPQKDAPKKDAPKRYEDTKPAW